MAITKVSGGVEQIYEKEVATTRKVRFTIKQLDAQIAQLQARIAELEKDKVDAEAIRD
jgi:predicted kinase